jgi:hypothetical protein
MRTQRTVPLQVALACTGLAFVVLVLLRSSRAMLASLLGVLIAGVLALAKTTRWKISLHVVGITGVVITWILLLPTGCATRMLKRLLQIWWAKTAQHWMPRS